jgi:hypothetical protein
MQSDYVSDLEEELAALVDEYRQRRAITAQLTDSVNNAASAVADERAKHEAAEQQAAADRSCLMATLSSVSSRERRATTAALAASTRADELTTQVADAEAALEAARTSRRVDQEAAIMRIREARAAVEASSAHSGETTAPVLRIPHGLLAALAAARQEAEEAADAAYEAADALGQTRFDADQSAQKLSIAERELIEALRTLTTLRERAKNMEAEHEQEIAHAREQSRIAAAAVARVRDTALADAERTACDRARICASLLRARAEVEAFR